MDRIITVKGAGKATARPDLIVVAFDIIVVEPEYKSAMEKSAYLISSLRKSISETGLEEHALKTIDFNVDTKYESYRDKDNNWEDRFVGYKCTHYMKLEFDFDMELLSSVITVVAKSEVHPKFNIRFAIKDQDAILEQLLENAINDSKQNAKILTRAANVKLGDIQRIDYSWAEVHHYSDTDISMCAEQMLADDSVSYDITPEDIEVCDTVTVVWSIE